MSHKNEGKQDIVSADDFTDRVRDADRKTTMRVFRAVVELFVLSLMIYFIMLMFESPFTDRFAQVVMSPLLTILAGATGFYFGNKQK